jgi:hypothetical protein
MAHPSPQCPLTTAEWRDCLQDLSQFTAMRVSRRTAKSGSIAKKARQRPPPISDASIFKTREAGAWPYATTFRTGIVHCDDDCPVKKSNKPCDYHLPIALVFDMGDYEYALVSCSNSKIVEISGPTYSLSDHFPPAWRRTRLGLDGKKGATEYRNRAKEGTRFKICRPRIAVTGVTASDRSDPRTDFVRASPQDGQAGLARLHPPEIT